MSLNLELIAKAQAFLNGRAQPFASHRRMAIQDHALVVSPLVMAGEDTAIHILLIGNIDQRPQVYCVPDPRERVKQAELVKKLGMRLRNYFQSCSRQKTYPQLIVTSEAGAKFLDALSEKLRFNKRDQQLSNTGRLLSYFSERRFLDGQQALHTATGILREHWVTGQDPGEDEHLLTLLTWITPPLGQTITQAVDAAERVPMGINTEPIFDQNILVPLIKKYNRALKANTDDNGLNAIAQEIQDALEPIITPIYEATQRAINTFMNLNLPWLPSLEELERREVEEFESFLNGYRQGYFTPLRDKPKRAAFGFVEREGTKENLEASLLLEDRFRRAEGQLQGRVVVGLVDSSEVEKLRPRKFIYRFLLRSSQSVLHVRQGDELFWASDTRLKLLVEDVRRENGNTLISLKIVGGQKSVGLPVLGNLMELVPNIPKWDWHHQVRGQLKERLAQTPWTHDRQGTIPANPTRPVPINPLANVEALR